MILGGYLSWLSSVCLTSRFYYLWSIRLVVGHLAYIQNIGGSIPSYSTKNDFYVKRFITLKMLLRVREQTGRAVNGLTVSKLWTSNPKLMTSRVHTKENAKYRKIRSIISLMVCEALICCSKNKQVVQHGI